MKKVLFIILLSLTNYCFGQISLEHVYSEGSVTRVLLENSGEKYYFTDLTNKQLKIYNSDHTIWKTIDLPVPARVNLNPVNDISESKINPDNLLELIYSYNFFDGTGVSFVSIVMNEEGTILLTAENSGSLSVSEIPGYPRKLIGITFGLTPTCKVYSLPDLTLENTYSDGFVSRIILENSGEKYYLTNRSTNQVFIYNSDHTYWKTIDLTVPPTYALSFFSQISETSVNPDNLIEVIYTYSTASGSRSVESSIINEDGAVILKVPNANSIFPINYPGLSNKLIATIESPTGGPSSSNVYSVPDLTLEKNYTDGIVSRIVLENSGEKYWLKDTTTKQVKFFNPDHTIWKNINLPIPPSGRLNTIFNVSENKINNDDLIEIIYTYDLPSGAGFTYESRLINEDGALLLTVPEANSIILSELAGLPNKLISTIQFRSISSRVYSLPPLVNIATLETFAASDIGTNTTTSGGNITDDGGGSITARGVVWSTFPDPTVDLSTKTVDGDGAGIFTSALTELTPNTTYYVRAYATNIAGTAYGNEVIFITANVPSSVVNLPEEKNKIKIFPNPTSNLLYIESGLNSRIDRIIIHNIDGKCILELPFNSNRIINVSGLSKGIYIIKGYDNNTVLYQSKFIVN